MGITVSTLVSRHSHKPMNNNRNDQQQDCDFSGDANYIVYAHDLAGNITFVNKAGELISGYSCDEARRMNVTEFIAPEFIDHVRAEFGQKIRVQLGTVQEIDIIAKDGKRVALEVGTRVILREGRPSEIQGIAVPSVLRGDSENLPGPQCSDWNFSFELLNSAFKKFN